MQKTQIEESRTLSKLLLRYCAVLIGNPILNPANRNLNTAVLEEALHGSRIHGARTPGLLTSHHKFLDPVGVLLPRVLQTLYIRKSSQQETCRQNHKTSSKPRERRTAYSRYHSARKKDPTTNDRQIHIPLKLSLLPSCQALTHKKND